MHDEVKGMTLKEMIKYWEDRMEHAGNNDAMLRFGQICLKDTEEKLNEIVMSAGITMDTVLLDTEYDNRPCKLYFAPTWGHITPLAFKYITKKGTPAKNYTKIVNPQKFASGRVDEEKLRKILKTRFELAE